MKVGDLVQFPLAFRDDIHGWQPRDIGIIIEIKNWVDSGDPDNNYGTDASVMWANGEIDKYDLYDLLAADDESR